MKPLPTIFGKKTHFWRANKIGMSTSYGESQRISFSQRRSKLESILKLAQIQKISGCSHHAQQHALSISLSLAGGGGLWRGSHVHMYYGIMEFGHVFQEIHHFVHLAQHMNLPTLHCVALHVDFPKINNSNEKYKFCRQDNAKVQKCKGQLCFEVWWDMHQFLVRLEIFLGGCPRITFVMSSIPTSKVHRERVHVPLIKCFVSQGK